METANTSETSADDSRDKDGYHGGRTESDTLAIVGDDRLGALVERTQRTILDAVPANTRRAYEGDLKRFATWCTSTGLVAMPTGAPTLCLYMRALADAGNKVSTIERAIAAICNAHTRAGHASPWKAPLVIDMRRSIRRELGTRSEKKTKADAEILRRLLAVVPASLLGKRDRALLTLGWAGALRRSELVALEVVDITPEPPKGIILLIRESKVDQERRGELVPIFYSNEDAHCPIRSLDAWLASSLITSGPIFRALGRDDRLRKTALAAATVADRVKHYAKLAGLEQELFAAHSLRSGFVSTAARHGRDLDSIMVTTRHRSIATVREYIQRETLFERAAGEGLL